MNNEERHTLIYGHGFVLLSTLLVAGAVVACKHVSNVMHPLALTLVRFVIAALSMMPIILLKKSRRVQIKRALPRSLAISFFYCMHFVLMFASLRETSMLHVASIGTMTPLVTAILALVFLRKRITVKQILINLIAVFGTLVVVFNGSFEDMIHFSVNRGDVIFMISVVLISLYLIVMHTFHGGIDPSVLAFCTMLGGIFWVSLSMIIMDIPFEFTALQEWSDIASLFYLAIFTTSLTSYLMQKGSILLSANHTSAYQYLSPVLVAVLGFLILGTSASLVGWIGAVISTIATVLLLRKEKK